jgi:HK97 family phage prohead protease
MEYREFRGEKPGEKDGKLYGVAAPFSSETTIGDVEHGGWREEVAPGAFKKTISEGHTIILCDHRMDQPLARTDAGTLTLRETARGLEFEANPVDTSYSRDLQANIRAGNKGGMSIGFEPIKDDWYDDQGKPSDRFCGSRRVLREVRLPEISVVTNPAYRDTSVSARDELLAAREERAGDVDTATRKRLAAKGHALPDGSYPIPDKSHLHAAAVLAASKHGDYKAAKRLIRKRAAALGVDVNTLPGFGGKNRSAGSGKEIRIKKSSAKRVLQSHAELKAALEEFGKCDVSKLPPEAQAALAMVSSAKEHVGHIAHKEKLDGKSLTRSKEPDTSTPDEQDDLALRMGMRSREIEMLLEA